MELSVSEKVRIIMNRTGKNMTDLAAATDQSRQNLTNKMSRGNFTEKDILKIAEALGSTVNIEFTLPDGSKI